MIDAFRLISPQTMMLGQEPRQTTSNVGHLHKPSIQALIHGLNRHYYSIGIAYRKHELEESMRGETLARRGGGAAGAVVRKPKRATAPAAPAPKKVPMKLKVVHNDGWIG